MHADRCPRSDVHGVAAVAISGEEGRMLRSVPVVGGHDPNDGPHAAPVSGVTCVDVVGLVAAVDPRAMCAWPW